MVESSNNELARLHSNLQAIIEAKEKKEPPEEKTFRKRVEMSRRRILSRGFMGSVLIVGGSLSLTRTTINLMLEHGNKITDAPSGVKEIPDYIGSIPTKIPEMIEAVGQAIPQTPSALNNAAEYSLDEFKSIKFESANCMEDGSNNPHQHYSLDLPFVSDPTPEGLCKTYGEKADKDEHNSLPTEKKGRGNTASSSVSLASSIGSSLVLVGIGWKLANSGDGTHKISRRSFLERVARGASIALITHLDLIDKSIEVAGEQIDRIPS